MKVDDGSEAFTVTEAASAMLDSLDAVVHALGVDIVCV